MKAIETATPEVQATPAPSAGQPPDPAQVTAWLLEGRFFTVDPNGAVTVWSPIAAETFGWRRKDIVGEPLTETLTPDVELPLGGGCTGAVTALNADARSLGAEFAFVPIKLSVGYKFNSLLQEIGARSSDEDALDEIKARHDSVLALIESALTGADGEGEDRPAGALVVFRVGAAVADGEVADNVVSIADAAGSEEARAQLERARRDAEESRVEIRNLEGQLEEARREAQRARNEADVARQEASDLRDSLLVAQRQAEDAGRQLEDSRDAADEARAAVETARIRSEEARRESDGLREQLREAREAARGMASRADEELAEVRAEAARHASEVAPLRERYQEAQRELGALRADLESARGEAEALRRELDAERTATGSAPVAETHELRAVRGRLARMLAAFDGAPVGSALIAPDGRFLDVSSTLCSVLGYDKDQLLSPEPPAIVHPDDVDAHRELFARMLAGEQTAVRGVRRYLDAEGRTLTMRECVALLRDGDGRPDAFVVQLDEAHEAEPVAEVVDAELALAPPQASAGLDGDAMRRALDDELFELHCQPLLDLRTNDVSQYELLIRMRTDDGRLILPEAFLGPARRAGLAHAIDRWVVSRAVRLLVANEHVSLEVNLSPEAVHDPELATMIEEELTASAVDPARLVLEVAGNTAVDSLEETRVLAKRLRALGCKFALDDFRSNFGSFRLVRELPLDYLKLDGELVASLAESRTSQLIVKALVDVAAGTGMSTVAVFVSDEETVRLLRKLDVDYAQGYTVGRPRPVGEVLRTDDPRQLPAG